MVAIGTASAATPESWAIFNRTRILKSRIARPRYNTCLCHSLDGVRLDARGEKEVAVVEKEWRWSSQAEAEASGRQYRFE